MDKSQVTTAENEFDSLLEKQLDDSRAKKKVTIQQFLEAEWQGMEYATPIEFEESLPFAPCG